MENITEVRKAKIIRIEPGQTGVQTVKDATLGEYDFCKKMYGRKVRGNPNSFVILENPKAHTFMLMYTERHEKIKFDIRNRILSIAVASGIKKKRVTQAFCEKLKNNLPTILEVYPREYKYRVDWLLTPDSENTLLTGIMKTIQQEHNGLNKKHNNQ